MVDNKIKYHMITEWSAKEAHIGHVICNMYREMNFRF